jgi:hypothetical protein
MNTLEPQLYDDEAERPVEREPEECSRAYSSLKMSYSKSLEREMDALVQQVFFRSKPSIRNVLFCSADDYTDSLSVCAITAAHLARLSGTCVTLVDSAERLRLGTYRMETPSPKLGRSVQSSSPTQRLYSGVLQVKSVSELSLGLSSQPHIPSADGRPEDGFLLVHAGSAISDKAVTPIGPAMDAAVLVIEAGHTKKLSAICAQRALHSGGCNVVGTILNNRQFPVPALIYRYL